MGLSNMAATIPGIVGPIVTKAIGHKVRIARDGLGNGVNFGH